MLREALVDPIARPGVEKKRCDISPSQTRSAHESCPNMRKDAKSRRSQIIVLYGDFDDLNGDAFETTIVRVDLLQEPCRIYRGKRGAT